MSNPNDSAHRIVIELHWSGRTALALAAVVVIAAALLFVSVALARVGSSAISASPALTTPTVVSYQGRVTVNGRPYNGTGQFKFAIVSADGSVAYWSNDGTGLTTAPFTPTGSVALNVSDGLFSVLLGDPSLVGMTQPITPGVFLTSNRAMRVWFDDGTSGLQQLTPDVAIAVVPFALTAETLDGLDSSAFAASSHAHSGVDITGGTLPDARLSANIARTSDITPTVAAAGFITRSLADGLYMPVTQTFPFPTDYLTKTLADTTYAQIAHPHNGADIISGTLPDARLSANIARVGDITPTVWANDGVGSGLDADLLDGQQGAFYQNASNINAGLLNQAYIDPAIARKDDITPMFAAAGFITQTLADARYARLSPTTQQIALLKWYTAISTSQEISFPVGAEPNGIAFDGANMWVTNGSDGTVSVLRASDGALVNTVPVGDCPTDIAFDGVNMWVTNWGNGVNVLRASDGFHVMTLTVGAVPLGIAFDGTNMWVTNSGDTVSVLRASDGALVMTPAVGSKSRDIAFDGTNMWVVNWWDDTPPSSSMAAQGRCGFVYGLPPGQWHGSVSVLRASDGFHVMTPTLGSSAGGIAFDGENMWVSGDNMNVLRASDGFHVMTLTVAAGPSGIAFDGANMWMANGNRDTVSVLSASDGALVKTVPVGHEPRAIAFDGAFMWVTNRGSNTVSKR